MRIVLLLLLLAAQAAVLFYTKPAPPPPPPVAKTYLPLFGLDRKKEQSGDWEARRMRRLEKELEGLRALRFKRPVPAATQSVQQLTEFINKALDREIYLGETEIAYKALGFIPETADLRALYMAFYASQIAGYYDPETGHFYTIKRSGLSSLLSSDEELELIMIHELDHALTDQHFSLKKLEKRILNSRNDDAALAIQSVIEGDAMAVMLHAMNVRQFGMSAMDDAFPASAFEMYAGLMEWLNFDPAWRSAPRLFRKLALFPYLTGGAFIDQVRIERAGWDSINTMYRRPPLSSEQILHPEKYPEEIPLKVTAPGLPSRFRKATENTAGEALIRLWLEEHGVLSSQAMRAAAGWGGDRYAVGFGAGGARMLAWRSVWDTPADAAQFHDAARAALKHAARKFRLARQGREVRLEQWGKP
ncbi:MAG: hypothetical protein FJX76_28275 [Armatimonadetes bacterium]|nr:hypothetical protein [Armatimonadota bacterium]